MAGLVLVAGAFQGGWLLTNRPRRRVEAEAHRGAPEPAVEQQAVAYLLVANLLRSGGVSAGELKHTLEKALAFAQQVAAERDGAALELPDDCLLLALAAAEGEDRALEVVAATLDLRKRRQATLPMSNDAAPASFRYCLDTTAQAVDDAPCALAAEPPVPTLLS